MVAAVRLLFGVFMWLGLFSKDFLIFFSRETRLRGSENENIRKLSVEGVRRNQL